MNSREITKTSGSNFVNSFWFLPKKKRHALEVIYAYCRLTDDLVDLSPSSEEAKTQLSEWKVQTRKSLEDGSDILVLKELSNIVETYHIPSHYFFELIDGVETDIEKKQYATFDELYRYCYAVASIVGLMCIQVFGCRSGGSKDFAIDLGLAFQLTNILRDIRTDAQRGRVYLPVEDLKKFGLTIEDLLNLKEGATSKVIDLTNS